MAEEKRDCTNCGNGIICACTAFNQWQPIAQEKPMEKIQMTEDQAMCLYRMAGDGHVEFIKRLKQKGYIRKSAVEEAEEYETHVAEIMNLGLSCTIKDLENSIRIIRSLKSEIARLRK